MNTFQFQHVIITGRTQLAGKCAEIAARAYPWLRTYYFNTGEDRPPKSLEELNNLEYAYVDKKQLMDRLRETTERTLVFSITNGYLFPEDVIANSALLIINRHSALLPKHPGRNAEAWAIFEGDDIAGITWHMVTAEVDAGEIISQHHVKIEEDMTSLSLYRELNRLSIESFPDILEKALSNEKIETYPQPSGTHYKLHYAKDRPADGVLSLDWTIAEMSRFVRAMDYSILKLMGDPIIWMNGKKYTWKKYAFADASEPLCEKVEVSLDEIRITKKGKELRLIGIKEIC